MTDSMRASSTNCIASVMQACSFLVTPPPDVVCRSDALCFYTWVRASSQHTQWQSKIPPEVFWHFPKWLGIFSPNFTCLLYVPIYAWLQYFIQLSSTVTKLCDEVHIKCDHPACVFGRWWTFWAWWSRLIWHNFVKVAGNWIKMCSLA